jgi:hypothetical protein
MAIEGLNKERKKSGDELQKQVATVFAKMC